MLRNTNLAADEPLGFRGASVINQFGQKNLEVRDQAECHDPDRKFVEVTASYNTSNCRPTHDAAMSVAHETGDESRQSLVC